MTASVHGGDQDCTHTPWVTSNNPQSSPAHVFRACNE